MANTNDILQSILPITGQVNAVTNLHDDQIAALRGILAKADKAHAQEFVDQVGFDKARQLADAHDATSPTNTDNQSSSNSSILDPLIAMAQKGQTQLPAQAVDTPASPSNVQRGNFEFDKPANLFEQLVGRPQVFQDAQGVTHYKPGGFLGAGANNEALANAQSLQEASGTKPVQPQNSIAYSVEQAKQQAEQVPMTQAQKAEYNLSIQQKGLELAKGQIEQFNAAAKPTMDILGKIDTLTPLAQAAMNGDKTAQGQYIAGLKDLSGASQNGNILNQSLFEKLLTAGSGKIGNRLIQQSLQNVMSIRSAQLKKLAGLQNNTASRIGTLTIGDKSISPNQLLNHPYTKEVSQITNSFKTEAEAKKAGLPDGTPITVNGVTGTWSN